MTLPIDTILENRYRIDRLLGQGGMGAIYRGFDIRLNRRVAIKENFFQTPHSIRQFEREAIILADLTHPNLPRVGDHFSSEGQQYLVMDFIEGQDLWEMVKRQQRPLVETQALDYIKQVCEAVQYLHRRKQPIIHRDIKPQNIKITPKGQAVLVDFGIAKIAEGGERTNTGARGVTAGFSPPEQYSGEGTTPLSDVYSLGATLYAVLTGQKPPDSISLLTNPAKFKSPLELNAKLSQQVSQAVLYAMQPQQVDRPPSVAAWQKELEAILEAGVSSQESPHEDEELTVASAPPTEGWWLVDPRGQSYKLKPGSLIFGRAKSCDIRVNDRLVSREHSAIEFDGENCIVYDEGSANGTFVNEQRVGTEGQPFKLGDRLRIGETIFSLSATAPEAGSDVGPVVSLSQTVDEQAETASPPTVAAPVEAEGRPVGMAPTKPEPFPAPTPATPLPATSPQPGVQTRGSKKLLAGGAVILIGGMAMLLAIGGAIIFFVSQSRGTATSIPTQEALNFLTKEAVIESATPDDAIMILYPTSVAPNTPPPIATPTTAAIWTPTPTDTPLPTAPETPLPPPDTPTVTPLPTASETPLPPPDTPTATPLPTASETPLPPTNTPTATPLPTATETPLPPPTNTPTAIPLPTATETPSPPSYWLGEYKRTTQSDVSSQKFGGGFIVGREGLTTALFGQESGTSFTASIVWDAADGEYPNVPGCPIEQASQLGPRYGFGKFWCMYPNVRSGLIKPVDVGQTDNIEVTEFSNGYSFFIPQYGSFEIHTNGSWKR